MNFKFLYILILFVLLTIPQKMKSLDNQDQNTGYFKRRILLSQNKKADRKFNKMGYTKAIVIYENLLSEGFAPDSVKRNLAISCLKKLNTSRSEFLFRELINSNEADTMDYYYYAQSLKHNEKYKEADIWIEKYIRLRGEDPMARLQQNGASAILQMKLRKNYIIEPVYFNSEYSDFGAFVWDNKLIFTSARKNDGIIEFKSAWTNEPYLDLFITNAEKPSEYDGPKLLSKGINSRYHDGPACFGSNGNEVFVTRSQFQIGLSITSKDNIHHFTLYHAKKKGLGWGVLKKLPFNSHEYSCGHPSITADNSTLFFASDMPGGYGGSDIYYVNRRENEWSVPVNLGPDVNTEGDEMFPYISRSGELFFSSNGHFGFGGLDIYMATSLGEMSYGILNMGYPLNSSSDDFSFFLMENEMEGYFASGREEGKGDDDIYRFTMLVKPSYFLNLIVTIKNTVNGEHITDADVTIFDENGNTLTKDKSNSLGQIEVQLIPYMNYSFIRLNRQK